MSRFSSTRLCDVFVARYGDHRRDRSAAARSEAMIPAGSSLSPSAAFSPDRLESPVETTVLQRRSISRRLGDHGAVNALMPMRHRFGCCQPARRDGICDRVVNDVSSVDSVRKRSCANRRKDAGPTLSTSRCRCLLDLGISKRPSHGDRVAGTASTDDC